MVIIDKENDSLSGVSIHVNRNLIESSDFDCVLCYRPLWRPVVTPCGHTYCSVSLNGFEQLLMMFSENEDDKSPTRRTHSTSN